MRQGWARRFATGLPCRARCAVSSLRAGIPRASIRFAHSALRLAGGSLRSPPSAGPIRPWPRSTAPAASPPCPPRHGAARRARRGAGFASARRRRTPCVAGAGFAVPRAAHRAGQACPHKCGHFRPRLRQRASRDCLRVCRPAGPLKRHGGSDLPASPASIPPSLIPQIWPFRTAGAALVFTPDASLMLAAPWPIMAAIHCASP